MDVTGGQGARILEGDRHVVAAGAALHRGAPLVAREHLARAARLYVSKHTVKTQAISIYRKLGASSRGQAVQRLQEIGLLAA